MALLQNITYSPGEPMQAAFDKINAAINAINDVLGGGTAGQTLLKDSTGDFDTLWGTISGILPPQGGFAKRFLRTDSTNASWEFVDEITDGVNIIKHSIIPIGAWNMQADVYKYVNHGIADWTKILSVQGILVNDANNKRYPWTQRGESGLESSGTDFINSSQIRLFRTNGAVGDTNFSSSAFSSTANSRGFLIVTYLG